MEIFEDVKMMEYRCSIDAIHMTIILMINNKQYSFWPWIQKRYDRERREGLRQLYDELKVISKEYQEYSDKVFQDRCEEINKSFIIK